MLQIHHPKCHKHQVRHLKIYADKNTKYANQNDKFTISIKRIYQPKNQLRHPNKETPSTPYLIIYIISNNKYSSKFIYVNLLSRICALFGVQLSGLKIVLTNKKWKIKSLHDLILNTFRKKILESQVLTVFVFSFLPIIWALETVQFSDVAVAVSVNT